MTSKVNKKRRMCEVVVTLFCMSFLLRNQSQEDLGKNSKHLNWKFIPMYCRMGRVKSNLVRMRGHALLSIQLECAE